MPKRDNLTKWAPEDVPVRIPSIVVAVPIERTIIRAVVDVAAGDDHGRAFLYPHIYL